jgi:hypothetical protein
MIYVLISTTGSVSGTEFYDDNIAQNLSATVISPCV